MILYYALGGGVGHIMRAARIARYYQLETSFQILTNSACASNLFPGCNILKLPDACIQNPQAISNHLQELLKQQSYQSFWVDTFPFGLFGELDISALTKLAPCHYVARYVKWPEYAGKLKTEGQFAEAHIVDFLHRDQQTFIHHRANEVHNVVLDNSSTIPVKNAGNYPGAWLILHSGNQEELDELVSYALDIAERENCQPKLIVASQHRPTSPVDTLISSIPHAVNLDSVARVISACGYNTMLELAPYRHKHHFMPFPRRYDDQFLRAARARGI